jgi:hypothetical protein
MSVNDALVAEAVQTAEQAIKQLADTQKLTIEVATQTVKLAEFSVERLNTAILQITGGNRMAALMILAELRLKFDKFIEANKGLLSKVESKSVRPDAPDSPTTGAPT